MLLAIDIGNGRVKAGLFNGNELVVKVVEASNGMGTVTDWEKFWELIEDGADLPSIRLERIAYSSVNLMVQEAFVGWRRNKQGRVPVLEVRAGLYPYQIHYSPPNSLGADRLADALGGFRRCGGPLIVVDFGTAVTLNVVGSNGDFLGGAIAPGAVLMLRALHDSTSHLPLIDIHFPAEIIGESTVECIASAVTYGLVDLVDGLIDRIESTLQMEFKTIATGSEGGKYVEHSRKINNYQPNLTLEGIAAFASINTGRK